MAKATDDDAPLNLDDMQVLTEAIAGTEKEIFSEATGGTGELLDESGDRSLEEMGDGLAGEHEPDEDEPEVDATIDAKDGKEGEEQPRAKDGTFEAKPEGQAEDKHPVPRGVLQEERGKRQTAEQLLAAEREQRANDRKEFDARMAALEAKVTAPKEAAKPAAVEPQKADIFLDHIGWEAQLNQGVERRLGEIRTENSLRFASLKHGEETIAKALAEVGKLNPADPAQFQIGQSIARAADPGEALVKWFKQSEAQKRIGGDVDAFETRVKAETREALMKDPEFRKQILADLQAEASTGLNGRPRTVVNIPSLNGASGSNSARTADPELYNNSDKSVFGYATG